MSDATQPTWKLFLERYQMQPVAFDGQLVEDPFVNLAAMARTWEQKYGLAPSHVALTCSTASDDYSKQRITVMVSCPCPSSEALITATTEAAFIVGRRLLNQMAATVGLPLLEDCAG